MTVSSYSSYLAFLEGYTRACSTMQSGWDKARAWLKTPSRRPRPEVRLEASRRRTMGMSVKFRRRADGSRHRQARNRCVRAAGPPQRGSKDAIVIALDEFQASTVQRRERRARAARGRAASANRRLRLRGSEPSLMERMLGPKRPFYKAGPVMRLEKIPPDIFAPFIESRFAKTGIKPEAGLGAAIVELAGNMPYDVQRLAHESWDDARASAQKRIGVDDLHQTLHRLLAEQATMFESRLAEADARTASHAEGRRAGGWPRAAVGGLRARYRLGGARRCKRL
jgi:hypothetical protein